MIADNDLLFVVDGDYLFRSAQAIYGKEYRISYPKLQEVMRRGRDPRLCYHMSIFVTVKASMNNSQLGFVSRLSHLGFDIHAYVSEFDPETGEVRRKSYTEEMIEFIKDFRCGGNYPRTLVVASASAALADLYIGLAYLGVLIEVMYVGTLSAKITDIHKSIVLSDDVIYRP